MNAARRPAAEELTLEALGDAAVLVRFGEVLDAGVNGWVHELAGALRARQVAGVVDLVPAYAALAVHFDAPGSACMAAAETIRRAWTSCAAAAPVDAGRSVEVPVRYGGDEGPDLDAVAQHTGLSPHDVVRRHAAAEYRVAMIGFSPGFPYLLGLDRALATPRLAQPRARLAAGSVAIGGTQTGIYPHAGPGGWRVIGRTPLRLFDATREPASLLQPGDRVRFVDVSGR